MGKSAKEFEFAVVVVVVIVLRMTRLVLTTLELMAIPNPFDNSVPWSCRAQSRQEREKILISKCPPFTVLCSEPTYYSTGCVDLSTVPKSEAENKKDQDRGGSPMSI